MYLSVSDEFIDKENRELVGSTPEGRPEEWFFQVNVPRDGVADMLWAPQLMNTVRNLPTRTRLRSFFPNQLEQGGE